MIVKLKARQGEAIGDHEMMMRLMKGIGITYKY